jgi:transcriptional regulator with XRE-family HTH domain
VNDLTDLSQDGIRAWLLAKCDELGTTPTGLARAAKVNSSTLTRFACKPDLKHRLSATTIEKIQAAIAKWDSAKVPSAGGISDRIRLAREAAGLSQEDLGSRLGVSRAAISQWETKEARPGIWRLEEIGAALGVKLEWLLAGADTASLAQPTEPSFASRLREHRMARGWTQETAADVLGVTQPTIHRWENGQGKALDLDPRDIADKLGVSPAWLMGLDGETRPSPGKVRIAIDQEVSVDQAARIFAILNERQ